MSTALQRITADEYLAFDRAAERPHELIAGIVYRRADANFRHCMISSNVMGTVGNALKATPFRVYAPQMRVRASANVFLYPDLTIGFGQPESVDQHNDILVSPRIIFEVFSPETELRDRGIKFEHYRSIPSLQTYVLVGQDLAIVECYIRLPEQEGWMLTDAQGLDSVIQIPGVEIELPLREVYDRVEFPMPEGVG